MPDSALDFPPHLLGLEFLEASNFESLFELVGTSSYPAGEVASPRVGRAAGSPILKAAVTGAVRRLNGESVALLDGAVSSREKLYDVHAAAPLVDVFVCSFTEHRLAELLAEEMSAPVLNLASQWAAPCQILADYYTISQNSAGPVKIRYFGRGDEYCHSLMRASALLDFRLELCPPPGGGPDEVLLASLVERGAPIELRKDAGDVPEKGWVYLGRGSEAALFPDFQELVRSPVNFLLAPASPWRGRRKLIRDETTGSNYRRQLDNFSEVLAACCHVLGRNWTQ